MAVGKAREVLTRNFKSGDHVTDTWEEGSHLKEYVYKTTGGTGKYQGASGGGTYSYDNLTDTLGGGQTQRARWYCPEMSMSADLTRELAGGAKE